MDIPESMDKLARLQPAYLRYHQGQQGIGSYIERHTQKYIRTALIKLTAQLTIRYIELEQSMTGHQCHIRQVSHIPCADDQPATVRGLFDLVDNLRDLVDRFSIGPFPATPLLAIDRPQLSLRISP